jgi:hypothetical protein
VSVKGLSIYAELDPDLLTDAAKAWFVRNEPNHDYDVVDIQRTRTDVWTEEILGAATGYQIRDEQGAILAKFDTVVDAEEALKNASVEFKVNVSVPSRENRPPKVAQAVSI